LLVFLLLLNFRAARSENSQIYERVNASVVCVIATFKARPQSVGSGFFIAPNIVATTSHQVSGATRISITGENTQSQDAKLVGMSEAQGLALLEVQSAKQTPLALSRTMPHIGEEVFTIGCPLGYEHSITRGAIGHAERKIDGKDLIQMDMSVVSGNSGGPLVHSASGAVVGIVYGYLRQASNISFALPSREIDAVVAARGISITPAPQTVIGLRWEQVRLEQDPHKRIQLFEELIRDAPWLTEALYNQGVTYLELGQHEAARAALEQAIRQRKDYYQAYTNLGLALFKLGRHEEARDALLKAVSIAPNFALAFLNLGIVYQRGLGEKTSAERAFRRYLELDSDSADAAQVRGWLESHKQ
jgi:hypothetical protein